MLRRDMTMTSKEQEWSQVCRGVSRRLGILARAVTDAVASVAAGYEKGLRTVGLISGHETESERGTKQAPKPVVEGAVAESRETLGPGKPKPRAKAGAKPKPGTRDEKGSS